MDGVVVVSGDDGVLEDAFFVEAVVPGRAPGQEGIGLVARPFNVLAVRHVHEDVVAHVLADEAALQGQCGEGEEEEVVQSFHYL